MVALIPEWLVLGGVAWTVFAVIFTAAVLTALSHHDRKAPRAIVFDLAAERARRHPDPFVEAARQIRRDYDDATWR